MLANTLVSGQIETGSLGGKAVAKGTAKVDGNKKHVWRFALLLLLLVMLLYRHMSNDAEERILQKDNSRVIQHSALVVPEMDTISDPLKTHNMLAEVLDVAADVLLPAPPSLPTDIKDVNELVVEPLIEHSKPDITASTPAAEPAKQYRDRRPAKADKPAGLEATVAGNTQKASLWLAQIEHGDGPEIVLAWPEAKIEREWIQQRLYGCGVRLGKWRNGRLSAVEPGIASVSGFVRVVNGPLSRHERVRLDALVGSGKPVRLFTRTLDVKLLSRLAELTGNTLMNAQKVRARYQRAGEAVMLKDIRVDDRTFAGGIALLSGRCR